jgi:hypothetical protein
MNWEKDKDEDLWLLSENIGNIQIRGTIRHYTEFERMPGGYQVDTDIDICGFGILTFNKWKFCRYYEEAVAFGNEAIELLKSALLSLQDTAEVLCQR